MVSTSGIGRISLKGQGFRIARPGEAMAARALAFRKKKNYITVIIQLLWALRMLKGKSDGVEMGLLLAGIVTVLVAYFLPAVTFSGQRGAAVYGLSIFSKLPIMSALAFAAMAAALATRFVPSIEKYAEQAAVIAILLVLAPALLGFMMALDPWTGIRQTMLKMANARTVKVDPSFAYIPLFAGATMMGFSLRRRMRRSSQASVAA
jgi:glycerol-3-phosphate acyltransferase PlsY